MFPANLKAAVFILQFLVVFVGCKTRGGSSDLRNDLGAKPVSTACWHAEMMRVHDHLLSNTGALKDDRLVTGIADLSYVGEGNALSSKMVAYGTTDRCHLVIAFRGTDTSNFDNLTRDMSANVNALIENGYHKGFTKSASYYAGQVSDLLKVQRELCKDEKSRKISITGHSLGGAVSYAIANVAMRSDLPENGVELVLFGSPRVAASAAPAESFPAVHYIVHNDWITNLPPNPPFRDLTVTNFEFESASIVEPSAVSGQFLIQNHVPAYYRKKMELFCKSQSNPKSIAGVSHSFSSATVDSLLRTGRAGLDAAVSILPDTNSVGGKLPTGGETVSILVNTPNSSKGDPEVWNRGDGENFAGAEACNFTKIIGFTSKTTEGRNYYCNDERTGFNNDVISFCDSKCQSGKSGRCVSGCQDAFHDFCTGLWSCETGLRRRQ